VHISTSVLWLFFFTINTLAGYRSDNFSSRCYCCKVTVGRTIGALGHGFALTRLYWFREASWYYDRVTCHVKVKGFNYYQSFLDPFALELTNYQQDSSLTVRIREVSGCGSGLGDSG
jgi:uncharacterized membrane protein (DUF485 family)